MRLHKIVRDIIILLLGAMIYGFICEAVKISASREVGNFGGEVLILPLMAGLVWLGWELNNWRDTK